MNGVNAEVLLGSVEEVSGRKFYIVLANINRNTIMMLMPDLIKNFKDGGLILFSGFLDSNFHEVTDMAIEHGIKRVSKRQKGEWLCLGFL